MGANALLGKFTHREGFDQCLKNLEITRVEDGKVLVFPMEMLCWHALSARPVKTIVKK